MNRWYKFYFALPDDNQFGLVGKALNRIVARVVKHKLEKQLPRYYDTHPLACGINTEEKRERRLICSLTSFPGRIDEIWKSIETIFRQTYKADEVVLWLADAQFPNRELPKSIVELQQRGLTVRWCDEDLRSHKKYFYALQEYKDADVVLLDDDLYYPERLLENLVGMARKHPGCICATRVHKMTYRDGKLCPYREWIHNYNTNNVEVKDLFFTSGAGTLIPSGVMPKDVFNERVFKEICFFADDVWLNMQAWRGGVKIVTNSAYNKDEISVGSTQREKLVSQNVCAGGNDKQLLAVINYLNIK